MKKNKKKDINKEVELEIIEENLEKLENELELNNENEQSQGADEMIELIDIHDEDYEKDLDEEFADVEFIQQDTKKKKKSGKYYAYQVFRIAVTMVALIAFGYASYELTLVYLENDTTFDTKDEIANMFLQDVENDGSGNVIVNSNGETIVIENTSNGKAFVWNYEKMLAYNSEAVGYIRQDNGDYIDYPILQHSDNDYYLYHLPDHSWSSMGSIFLDYRIEGGLEADYSIIYGHYIGKRANNIMFGSLNWYWDWPSYHREHPTFDIYVKERHYKYYVFSIMKVPAAGDRVYDPNFASDAERLEFLKDVKAKSKYEFTQAPELTEDSKVIMLSTCTTDKTIRFVMFLVRGEEICDVPGVDYENDTSTEESTSKKDETTKPSVEETTTTKPTEPSVTPPAVDETTKPTEPDVPSETTTAPPETTTLPPETTTKPEETTTKPEETTTPPEETTTAPPETSTEPTESSEEDSSSEQNSEEQTEPME